MKKIKILFLLTTFTASSFNVFAQTSSLISNCSDFVSGPTAWPYVLVATTIADSAVSQGAQTFAINVIDTANGASFRVAKTTANGNWYFGNPIALTLGSNSITVPAVTFNRSVKFQFSNGDVEFNSLTLNGVASSCVVPPPPPSTTLISNCVDFVSGPTAWPYVLVATTAADGSISQGAQTFSINVTDTANGASFRVAKTVANGNWYFGNPVALTIGLNTITVPAVSFDRAVKFQFSNGDVEFNALSLNGEDSDCICTATSFTDVVEACDSYTWIDGNTYNVSNDTSTYTLVNAAGCDSIVSLDLTITTINAAIDLVNNSTLQAQSVAAGTTYQWFNCIDDGLSFVFVAIGGETNATFSPQTPGDYAVEITFNNCTVMSNCSTITSITGIDVLDINSDIQLFPNPTTNDLTLLLEGIDVVDIIVLDIQGKILLQNFGLFDQDRINLSGLDAGTYFVKIMTSEGSKNMRITKQ